MASKASIPKGTRDFIPLETLQRNYIFDTIKQVFTQFGFQPIETPAMENLSTLTGKYGAEGDKLLFKILNSGDFAAKTSEENWNNKDSKKLVSEISSRGLRYDLTVPFARFVVQHQNDLNFPFKRYQIQPVWRADRPQKGRYREFYQCDVDVIGSASLINELELIQIIENVFKKLNLEVVLKLNNRKILAGLAQIIDQEDKLIDLTVAIDKIDKIGLEGVEKELISKEIPQTAIDLIKPIISHQGSKEEKIASLKEGFKNSEIGLKGIEEMEELFHLINLSGCAIDIDLDLSLARGLNYYTGTIFEVKSKEMEIGSITGGGRYDDLTGVFGLKDMSGVGISFGADRIYDVLQKTNKFPQLTHHSTQVLFVNFGMNETAYILPLLQTIRQAGINAEIYPDKVKMKKQFSYANQKNIPFVAIVGEQEMQKQTVQLKNMDSGEQKELSVDELIELLS